MDVPREKTVRQFEEQPRRPGGDSELNMILSFMLTASHVPLESLCLQREVTIFGDFSRANSYFTIMLCSH